VPPTPTLRQKSATPEMQQSPMAPTFLNPLPSEIRLVPGQQKLSLSVQLEANPPAQIHWMLDGRKLADELGKGDFRLLTDRNHSELILEGGGAIRQGHYVVEASNAHGTVQSGTMVNFF
jgi:hypothetical protein